MNLHPCFLLFKENILFSIPFLFEEDPFITPAFSLPKVRTLFFPLPSFSFLFIFIFSSFVVQFTTYVPTNIFGRVSRERRFKFHICQLFFPTKFIKWYYLNWIFASVINFVFFSRKLVCSSWFEGKIISRKIFRFLKSIWGQGGLFFLVFLVQRYARIFFPWAFGNETVNYEICRNRADTMAQSDLGQRWIDRIVTHRSLLHHK